ncbi:hypothetical protein Mgra_00004099 [Meloidogyne graminicola]|uniref:Uncharacterized protein n=1 Tax=Meloidogyne graminicola TaxID=189291 RepID=A0A8S9ZSN1_9BILA|nr:hypothetical protein Mgra_00004099 [Meloidogyne graminicola]
MKMIKLFIIFLFNILLIKTFGQKGNQQQQQTFPFPYQQQQPFLYSNNYFNPYFERISSQNSIGNKCPPGTFYNPFEKIPICQNVEENKINKQPKVCGNNICQQNQHCLICLNKNGMTYEQRCMNQICPNNYFCSLNQYQQPYCQKFETLLNYGTNKFNNDIFLTKNSFNNPPSPITIQ